MYNNRKILIISLLLIICPIGLFLFYKSGQEFLILKLVFLILVIISLLFNINNKIAFNPKTFMLVFLGCSIFSTLGLSTQIEKWNGEMYIIIIAAAISYLIPCTILNRNHDIIKVENLKLNKQKVEKISTLLVFISFLASSYEFYKFGGIPIFTENLEVLRFQIRISGYIHILAIMSRVSFILIGSFWISKKKIDLKNDKRLIFNFIISFLLLLFTGFRGELIVPIAVLMIQYFVFNTINFKKIFLYIIIIIIILGVWPIFRNISSYGDSYIQNLIDTSTYPKLYFLLPFYLTFAMNFETLRKLTLTFPSVMNFGLGYYSLFVPFSSILPGNNYLSLYDVQNKVWDTGFYSGLTSTYLGTLYADGGILYIIIFNVALGIFISVLYNCMLKKRSWAIIAIYSYIMYLTFLGVYSYGLTIDNIFYIFLIYLVYKICAVDKNENYRRKV